MSKYRYNSTRCISPFPAPLDLSASTVAPMPSLPLIFQAKKLQTRLRPTHVCASARASCGNILKVSGKRFRFRWNKTEPSFKRKPGKPCKKFPSAKRALTPPSRGPFEIQKPYGPWAAPTEKTAFRFWFLVTASSRRLELWADIQAVCGGKSGCWNMNGDIVNDPLK